MSQRIVVIGSSGAGKSTLARRCESLGYARLELDGLMHQRDWVPLPEPEMHAGIAAFIERHERWVIDGNYARYRELIWSAADTIVWLDLPRAVVMHSLLRRTVIRVLRREVLWNGNRERWTNLTSFDPEKSVLAWSWTHFASYREDFAQLMCGIEYPHLTWHRLRSRREIHRTLARLANID